MEKQYLELLNKILTEGEVKSDRTGVGTISLFGTQLRFDLQAGFPLMTTKRLSFKNILAELLWFIEGSSDERRLAEITHGTRDPSKKTIWTANAQAPYWKPRAKFDGDLGRIYGVQWRHWQTGREEIETDQLAILINTLKTNPTDRRMILTAWNPGELSQMSLPSCHCFAQFHVSPATNRLNCMAYMRSVDSLLGMPYDIASYSALTHIIAKLTGYIPGEFIMNFADTHIYLNHVEQVKEQITREPYPFPTLNIGDIKDIDSLKMSDFELVGYQSHEAIKAEMAV